MTPNFPLICRWSSLPQLWVLETVSAAGAGGEVRMDLTLGITVTADRLSGEPVRLEVHRDQAGSGLLTLLVNRPGAGSAGTPAAAAEPAAELSDGLTLHASGALRSAARLALIADTPIGLSGTGLMELAGLGLLSGLRTELPGLVQRWEKIAVALLEDLRGRGDMLAMATLLARAGTDGREVLLSVAAVTGHREVVQPWLDLLPVAQDPLLQLADDQALAARLRAIADHADRSPALAARHTTSSDDAAAALLLVEVEIRLTADRDSDVTVGLAEASNNQVLLASKEVFLPGPKIDGNGARQPREVRLLLQLPEGSALHDPAVVVQDRHGHRWLTPLDAGNLPAHVGTVTLLDVLVKQVAIEVAALLPASVKHLQVRVLDASTDPPVVLAGGHLTPPTDPGRAGVLQLLLPISTRPEHLRLEVADPSVRQQARPESKPATKELLDELSRQACELSRRAHLDAHQDLQQAQATAAAQAWLRVARQVEELHALGQSTDRELIQALQRTALACQATQPAGRLHDAPVTMPNYLASRMAALLNEPELATAAAQERDRQVAAPWLADHDNNDDHDDFTP